MRGVVPYILMPAVCKHCSHHYSTAPYPASPDSTPDALERLRNIARCLLMLPLFLIKKKLSHRTCR